MPDNDKPRTGSAVSNGFLRFVSVSAIRSFNPGDEGGCNRRWAYRYVFGKKEPTTPALERGTESAAKLEHYLRTGSPALPSFLLVGTKLLPKPGEDLELESWFGGKAPNGRWNLERAIELRDTLRSPGARDKAVVDAAVMNLIHLTACGVPVYGAADYRHRRGVFVDGAGVLQTEPYPDSTEEIGDHKTSSDISKWSKSAEALETDAQMVGYGTHASNRTPSLTHVRLSHNYYQTTGRDRATKVTTLVPVDRLRRTWESQIEPVVRQMVDVARVKRPEEAEPNIRACRAFNRDCPHRVYCPLTPEQLIVDIAGKGDNMSDSLFAKYAAGTQAPVEVPPVPLRPPPLPIAAAVPPQLALRQSEVDAARERLLAEDAGLRPPVSVPATGFSSRVPVTACDPGRQYVLAEAGKPPVTVRHVGVERTADGSVYVFEGPDGRVTRRAEDYLHEVVARATVPPPIGAILPPDAARHNALTAADPLPREVIDQIADPEVRQRAEDLATRHADAARVAAAEAAASAGGGDKTSGRCPRGKQKAPLTTDQLASQRWTCSCGKVFEKTKFKPSKDGDVWVFEIPGHNLPSVPVSLPPKSDPPSLPASAAPPALAIPTAISAGESPVPAGNETTGVSKYAGRDKEVYDEGFEAGQRSLAAAISSFVANFKR